MDNELNLRQIELDNWVISKLDVEKYAWLLESAGSVGNFCSFLDDLVYRISKGYKVNKKKRKVCSDLGLI